MHCSNMDIPIPTYHLRRVNPKTNHSEELILLGEVTKFGRNADNVDVVLTSAVYSNMISRDHAVIMGSIDSATRQIVSYKIRDNSLNGTYIDDKRVKDEMILEDSSVIKFGHMNGAAIKAGAAAPQANAEFSFVFEKCNHNPINRKYIGWEGYERRRTVVCTGDGKFMTETGDDYRSKKKPPPKEPVSSTTTAIPPFPNQHVQSAHPQSMYPPPGGGDVYQIAQGVKFSMPFAIPTNSFNPAMFQQQQMAGFQSGLRSSGHYPHFALAQAGLNAITHQMGRQAPPINIMDGIPSSSTAPIRSPPVECDSSVPSPPKTGVETRTGHADSSSQHSPRRGKDDDEDSFSVPDSPPRAPRPIDIPGRSVTNSPAPPSPRPAEKIENPEEKKKKNVSHKKHASPVKVPKSGGGGEKKKNKEVDRLLNDLTEGSFAMQARRKSEGGAGSDRRKMISDGKKSVKRAVSKNKLHRQLSSASSDDDSDYDEPSVVHIQSSSSRPSMVGKKALSNVSKGVVKRIGKPIKGKKEASEESDPYEETDEESEGEKKNGKKKITKKTPIGKAKNEKVARNVAKNPVKNSKKTSKKKESDESSSSEWEESAPKEIVIDDFEDTESTKCGSECCKLPKQTNVHWVECDGCSTWYHTFCMFSTNLPYKGSTFFCGCVHPSKMKKN